MTGYEAEEAVLKNEIWITTNKNRYCRAEQVNATVHVEKARFKTNIQALLTEPGGKAKVLEPVVNGDDSYILYHEADIEGVYTIACIIDESCTDARNCKSSGAEEITKKLYICSTCFFVGECQAAIPKVPDMPLMFVPEMWENPVYYKPISFCLRNGKNPVPNVPVTLFFKNRSGCLKKELCTDRIGNVFFSMYISGTYCLVGKTLLNTGNGGVADIIASFSLSVTEREGKNLG